MNLPLRPTSCMMLHLKLLIVHSLFMATYAISRGPPQLPCGLSCCWVSPLVLLRPESPTTVASRRDTRDCATGSCGRGVREFRRSLREITPSSLSGIVVGTKV
ncbi:hypothetical protein R3P38DRAFT_3021692, partial [Favolaschia claudopus]